MGKMFHALGLLPADDLFEAKASDLVTGYTGQAGKCTREVLTKSLGGVLFIDEAYQLDPARGGTYMTEAVDELVGALTEDEFKGKVLVILAGYDKDMENMLKTNPGLKSRFSERIHFQDFDGDTIRDLLLMELNKAGIPLSNPAGNMAELNNLTKRLIIDSGDSFGNGRDVVTWANGVYKIVAKNYCHDNTISIGKTFCARLIDVEVALEQMLESRRVREGGQTCAVVNRSMDKPQGANADMRQNPPSLAKTIQVTKEDVCEPEDVEETSIVEESPPNMFNSLGNDVLNSLQTYIDEHGLGSKDGANHLRTIDPNSQEFRDLATRLARDTGLSFADACSKLTEWQGMQKDLEATIEKEKQKSKVVGTRPIWRCGVCGRADKPWIACYVAPFIVRYENVSLDDMAVD